MIKEWLLAKILKNKVVFFENDGKYHLINDITIEDNVVVCSYYERREVKE